MTKSKNSRLNKKTQTKTTKRTPRKNTRRYNDLRNERRKAQRRISSMQKSLAKTKSEGARKLLERRISNLQNAIDATRTYSKETGKRIQRTKLESEHAMSYLRSLNKISESYVQSNARQNKATEIEIRRAGHGGMYTKREVQLFYKETMSAWNRDDVPTNKRNEAILEAYGERNLADLFDKIVNNGKVQELERAREIIQSPSMYTNEQRRWAYEVLSDNEDDYITSPNSRKGAQVNYIPVEAPM